MAVHRAISGATAAEERQVDWALHRYEADLTHMPPLERLGTPDDIAAAVAFLAGPDGSWINGQVLRANGGIV